MDMFARLGLPGGFIEPEIWAEYLARSRELHPDYHLQGSAAEQAASIGYPPRSMKPTRL